MRKFRHAVTENPLSKICFNFVHVLKVLFLPPADYVRSRVCAEGIVWSMLQIKRLLSFDNVAEIGFRLSFASPAGRTLVAHRSRVTWNRIGRICDVEVCHV